MTKKEFAEIIFAGLKDWEENCQTKLEYILCFLEEEDCDRICEVIRSGKKLED